MNTAEILFENVSLYYDSVIAVRDLQLNVKKGDLFGLIGPDGAGKTSMMRMLCSLIKPSFGSISVRGLDVSKNSSRIRADLGYMPQRFSLYQDLTVEQNLRFFADLFQVGYAKQNERMEELYAFSKLGPFSKRKAGALSGGMKQKLALSCNLMHTPSIMILDEPTFGVDPVSREEFWSILHDLNHQGTTILVSTPYMEEAAQCTRIALIRKGVKISEGTPAEIISSYPYKLYSVRGNDLFALRLLFQEETGVHSIQLFGDSLHIAFSKVCVKDEWRRLIEKSKHNLINYEEITPSVEDVFLSLGT